jgi:hypothetical protein
MMMTLKSLSMWACGWFAAGASLASAQIIYEPMQSQFGGQNSYHYGGDNPRIHRCAAHPLANGWGRFNGFAWVSAGRVVNERSPRVFLDATGCQDASRLGATPNDAHNEAMRRVPTYFVKSELMDDAVPLGGLLIVPADAPRARSGQVHSGGGRIVIRPTGHSRRGPVIVFPKRMMKQKIVPPLQQADARL